MSDQDFTKLKVEKRRFFVFFQKRLFHNQRIEFNLFVLFLIPLKVAELREMLKLKGLNAVGNKQELIERLQVSMSESSGELNEDDLLNVRRTIHKRFQMFTL